MAKTDTVTKINVKLCGMRPIMFDRYAGDNKTKLGVVEKFYRNSKNQLVLPAANITSFLCSQNSRSAAKDYYDKRTYKDKAINILSFTMVEPEEPLLTRNGEPLEVTTLGEHGTYEHFSVARLEKGIPNPKNRPVLPLPWELNFTISVFPNDSVDQAELKELFKACGLSIGLGTYRGVFGKFTVEKWEKI
jgi:hypothetical protein